MVVKWPFLGDFGEETACHCSGLLGHRVLWVSRVPLKRLSLLCVDDTGKGFMLISQVFQGTEWFESVVVLLIGDTSGEILHDLCWSEGRKCTFIIQISLETMVFKFIKLYLENGFEMVGHSVVKVGEKDCMITIEVFQDRVHQVSSYTQSMFLKWQATPWLHWGTHCI